MNAQRLLFTVLISALMWVLIFAPIYYFVW